MLDKDAYLACKRQTRYLLWWLWHTSNTIIQSLPKTSDHDSDAVLNTTGEITCKELVAMANRVAEHMPFQDIPDMVFRLFESVISARSSANGTYEEIALHCEDEELEESNAKHKYFIDRLTEAFEILGGSEWVSSRRNETAESLTREEVEKVVFSNAFSELRIHQCADDVSDGEAGSDTQSATNHSRKSGKGKRKQETKHKKNRTAGATNNIPTLDVPLENFCLVDGPEGVLSDYRMALESIFVEFWALRQYVQLIWLNVTYEGANSAVAGAISTMAIAMIRKTAATVFVEFPAGFDTYRAMVRDVPADDHEWEYSLNFREAFSMHTYQDLLDFVIDYQKNRTGKPTKRMQAELSDWDPCFNLQGASMREKVEWRRSYTINWLYDLVNVFSHIVLQENKINTERQPYEKIEWTVKTPYHRPRKLFGIETFAETITTWAMQKPGSDIKSKVLPHHVFQLQCMVDSFTVSRGWAPGLRGGHSEYTKPLPAIFSATDCLKSFLGTHNGGFLSGAKALLNRLKDYQGTSDAKHVLFRATRNLLERFTVQMGDWLGKSDQVFTSQVPSRFSHLTPNGLWTYSPFLCGVGLVEALEFSYRLSMLAWDTIGEMVSIFRLYHRMLLKGYTGPEDALMSFLMHNYFSSRSKASNVSSQASLEESRQQTSRVAKYRHRNTDVAIGSSRDMQHALIVDGNLVFQRNSHLLVYRESDWDTVKVTQSEDAVDSMLKSAATVWDRDKTEKESEEDWALQLYRGDSSIFNSAFVGKSSSTTAETSEIAASTQRLGHSEYGPNGIGQLTLAEWDMVNDICDKRPLSGLDYMWITMKVLDIFEAVEKSLGASKNPICLASMQVPKAGRVPFCTSLVEQQGPGHQEFLEILETELEKQAMSVEQFIYWGGRDNRWPSRIGIPTEMENGREEEQIEEVFARHIDAAS